MWERYFALVGDTAELSIMGCFETFMELLDLGLAL